jgi:nucleotide-binding universal stress UspA family protein
VPHDHVIEQCAPKDVADLLVVHARLYDLTIFPVDSSDESQALVEGLVFGAGRPVLLLPEKSEQPLPESINTVAIAWDHSRPAARAVADALPLLQAAKRVSVLTVIDEKRLARPHSGVELCKHLARHGVQVTFEAVEAEGRAIGDVLEAHAAERNIDLLVMGVYGHSKLREFILGGATRSVLARPFTWTLVSH